ncbi:hypothetical protein C8F01DRAFT_1084443 [Mycena amicta]|nr:hypothetical protein C8F01DRAFT_1084443 [Mycena amicta]
MASCPHNFGAVYPSSDRLGIGKPTGDGRFSKRGLGYSAGGTELSRTSSAHLPGPTRLCHFWRSSYRRRCGHSHSVSERFDRQRGERDQRGACQLDSRYSASGALSHLPVDAPSLGHGETRLSEGVLQPQRQEQLWELNIEAEKLSKDTFSASTAMATRALLPRRSRARLTAATRALGMCHFAVWDDVWCTDGVGKRNSGARARRQAGKRRGGASWKAAEPESDGPGREAVGRAGNMVDLSSFSIHSAPANTPTSSPFPQTWTQTTQAGWTINGRCWVKGGGRGGLEPWTRTDR